MESDPLLVQDVDFPVISICYPGSDVGKPSVMLDNTNNTQDGYNKIG